MHPSIVCWVPFNERWGQHLATEVGNWMVARDPSRLVNVASGGNFWPVGDVVDAHSYPHPVFPFEQGTGGRFDDYVKVMGEFGGHGYPVQGHLWDADRRNWGYGGLPKNKAEYKARYVTSLNMLETLRHQGIAGGVYTQTTDVEGEINGLITYDRKVVKIPAEELAELHRRLFTPLAKKQAAMFPQEAFAGRFPGHGTPFQDRDGRRWCTAFHNANVAPRSRAGIETRGLRENAQTINEPGVTIVPLDVRVRNDGEVWIRAKDPAYTNPGPDEAQQFRGATTTSS